MKENFISQPIQGTADLAKRSIDFHVPEYHRWLYKLSSFSYTLPETNPKNRQPLTLEGQFLIQTPFTAGGGHVLQQAINIGTSYEGLQGTLQLSKPGYETSANASSDLILDNHSPPYQFAKHHPYWGYMQNSNIRYLNNVQSSDHSAALKNSIPNADEVYEAHKYTVQLEQLYFENYVIRAKLKDSSTCAEYPSFEYNMFYINGNLVNYTSTQTDQTACKTHYKSLSRFENGDIDSFGHSVYDNKSNRMHYAEWNYLCPKQRQSLLGQCVLAKSDLKEIQQIEADSRRIVKWFQP